MSSNPDAPTRSRLRWFLGGIGLAIALLIVLTYPGCRRYPPVSSHESLKLMQLLYAGCNLRDPARLTRVEAGVEKLVKAGKMSPGEEASFRSIVAQAKAGDWADAERAAFRFAQDQVGVGHPNPEGDTHDHAGHDHAKPAKSRKPK